MSAIVAARRGRLIQAAERMYGKRMVDCYMGVTFVGACDRCGAAGALWVQTSNVRVMADDRRCYFCPACDHDQPEAPPSVTHCAECRRLVFVDDLDVHVCPSGWIWED